MISSAKATARRAVTRTSRTSRRALAATTLRRCFFAQHRFYSTEKILQWRSGRPKEQLPLSLYNAADERENCGVGLIASLQSKPSRDIVEKADEMLVRMSHRGGCGCDPASGDGSGTFYFFVCAEIVSCVRCFACISLSVSCYLLL
jgi:hypothetical protein